MCSILRILVLLLCFNTSFAANNKIVNGPITLDTERIPKRVVTMNQSATEIMLSLGLGDKLVGTAYMDDTILPDLKAAYDAIPVLSLKYPSKEILLDRNPDFVYAGYISAFSAKRGLVTRQEFQEMGIGSYLSPSELRKKEPWKIEFLYQELREIAAVFHAAERAEQLVEKIRNDLWLIEKSMLPPGKKPRILWLDSVRGKAPFVGGGTGTPNSIINLAGGANVFAERPEAWSTVSKEEVVVRPVDIIVLIDASWDSASGKRKILAEDPIYQRLAAVQKKHYAEIPFSASTPGIRIPDAVERLRDAIVSFQEQR